MFKGTTSPHIHSPKTIKSVMRDVLIASLPAFFYSLHLWGLGVLRIYLVSVFFAHLMEFLFLKARGKKFILDGSAAVTGILFAMTLPPKISSFTVAVGVSFGIIFGKHFFGGLGGNIFNPALLGRVFLMVSYPGEMTSWISPLDATTCATPLGAWKFASQATWEVPKLFWGNCPGSVGETSAAFIIAGGIYLILRKSADWKIPFSYILTVFLISSVAYLLDSSKGSPLFHLFSGGLMLGAFFMATDPVTSPASRRGRFLYGAGCGIFTLIIRYFSGYPEGVMFSILFMNAISPLIEKLPDSKPFGKIG